MLDFDAEEFGHFMDVPLQSPLRHPFIFPHDALGGIQQKIFNLMLIMLMLVLLRFPMYRYSKAADFCKVAAGFTYYIHPLFIWMIDKVSGRFGFTVSETPRYLLVWAVTFTLAWCINRSDNRMLKAICC